MMPSFLEKAIFAVGLAPLVSWPLLAPSSTFIPDAEEELRLRRTMWSFLFSEQVSRPLKFFRSIDSPAFASSNN
jgi:hypothetical protein